MSEPLYRRICDPTSPHRNRRNGGECSEHCFAPVEHRTEWTGGDDACADSSLLAWGEHLIGGDDEG
jgi:hypothetical protein